MKNLCHSILLIVLIICCSAFLNQSRIPQELLGKWNLRGSNSKLIGTIEIAGDGKYSFVVAPNYKESGVLALNTEREPGEIDLVVRNSAGANSITQGIYRIRNNKLELCLGKMNEARPAVFNDDPAHRSIFWLGTK